VSAPRTQNPQADAARAVALALVATGTEWRPSGRVEDLGSSACLVVERGARRTPGADSRQVDTLERVRLHFGKEL
jgi:hypothetical protein